MSYNLNAEIRRWRKKAEKELKKEISNPYQEYIDWLTYDCNKSKDEDEKKNLLSLIHFFDRLGLKDGKSKMVGLFGYNCEEKENKLRRRRERVLIRKFGTLLEGDSKTRAVLEAEYVSVVGLGTNVVDISPFSDKYYDPIVALNNQGFKVEEPYVFSDFLKEKWKAKKR